MIFSTVSAAKGGEGGQMTGTGAGTGMILEDREGFPLFPQTTLDIVPIVNR